MPTGEVKVQVEEFTRPKKVDAGDGVGAEHRMPPARNSYLCLKAL